MSKDEIDFEWTVKDVDQTFLDAARGDGGKEQGKVNVKKPNLLNRMQLGNKLSNLTPRKQA